MVGCSVQLVSPLWSILQCSDCSFQATPENPMEMAGDEKKTRRGFTKV